MPFSWGAAGRGAGDALQRALAERYAKTQEAERVAREMAREQRAAEQWAQTMAFNQAEAARAQKRFEAEQAQTTRRNTREDVLMGREESKLKNEQGMRQMIGEFVTRIPEAGVSPSERRTLQAMQATEPDIKIAPELTAEEEMVTITVPGPGGRPYTRRVPASSLEGQGQEQYRAPVAGPQRGMVTLYRTKPGGGVENIDVTEGPEANKMYAQGWTRTAQKDAASTDEVKDTASEVQRMSGELARHKGFGGTFGKWSSSNPKLTSSQDTVDARRILGSLTGLLTLENMNKMKGVLSDSDMEILRSASSILAEELSEEAARTELNRLGRVMSKVTGNAWTEIETPGPAGYRPGAPLGAGSPAQNRPAAPPKVGDRRTINGAVGVWDGQGWAPE